MLALTLVALTSPLAADLAAFAEARAPLLDITDAFPAAETPVPANGRLVLFGGDAGDLALVRVSGDGAETPLTHTQIAVDQLTSAFIVALDGAQLTAGETLVVASRCTSGCSFTGAWTVAEPDDAPPTFDDGPVDIDVQPLTEGPFATTRDYVVHYTLPGARDDRGAVVLELRGGEGDTISPRSFGPGAPVVHSVTFLGGHARPVCFEAFAVDAAGNEARFASPDGAAALCADLAPVAAGCAAAPLSTSALGALGLLALLRVRRGQA